MTNSVVLLATFFGSKRIGTYDRLGSAKYNQDGARQWFYPYGEDRGTVEPNDSLKFATYTRDAATGLDYADQRYYASNFGRFMSPDPYRASGGSGSPASWNRYSYTRGDPVNRSDRTGLEDKEVDDGDCDPDNDDCTPTFTVTHTEDGGGGGGGDESCDDNPYQAECDGLQFGGGGGIVGASGPSAGNAHSPGSAVGPAGYSGALALLKGASANCLKDLNASGSAAAIAMLTGSTITYTWGTVPTVNANGNVVNGATPAQSSPPTGQPGSILINLNFGWMNPTNLTVNLTTGGTGVRNFVFSIGTSIGDPGLTTSQYYELVLLHELGHLLGVPQEPVNDPTYNKNIFNDCIKGN
jgi:RHS repeat-associated protein